MKKLQFFHKPEILEQAHELYRSGGPFRKAGEKVLAIIQLITSGERNPLSDLKVTNHGETRLEKCIKYDLAGASRLVTIQDNNKVFLLCVGKHDFVDKWLDSNRGKKFVVNECGVLEEIKVLSKTLNEGEKPVVNTEYSPGRLYEQIPGYEFDFLVDGVERNVVRDIEGLHAFSTEDDIYDVMDRISNKELQFLNLDVFTLLKAGQVEQAVSRLSYERGRLEDLDESAVDPSDTVFEIPTDDPRYAELFEHFVKTSDYKKWMLFMHPEQQELVDHDFKGSSKLLGISGSGKTCVVVKRAVRLAEKYTADDILVVTLNRSLARLIKELVDVVASEQVGKRIHVKPFFKVCQEYLYELEPGSSKLYDDRTWKSHEHIDEIWTEYYRCELNNNDAEILLPVHDHLIAMGINSESYIKEEFDWIRSAFENDRREDYLNVERKGRSVRLQMSYRKMILQGLSGWERKMKAVGVTDYVGLASALSNYADKIEPRYRCALVDESQDFGTTELSIIRKLTFAGENDVFICGDAAQRVSTKFQSLREAGLSIQGGNSKKLYRNYRNSKEILSSAYTVFSNYFKENEFEKLEDFELLQPEFSNFSGPVPVILKGSSLEDELSYSFHHAEKQIEDNATWKVCIAICGYSLHEIGCCDLPSGAKVLDGDTSLSSGSIFVSDLEQAKGFEFDMVIILNASKGVIPNPLLPKKEHYREICHLYVSMTRAKSELVVSYNEEKSSVFDQCSDVFYEDSWNSFYPEQKPSLISTPRKMAELHSEMRPLIFMTGPEFLYSEKAVGLKGSLIMKLRNLVSGEPLNRQGTRVRWRNLGSAFDSISMYPRSRQEFGIEGVKDFRYLCESLDIPEKVKIANKKELYQGQVEEKEEY